MKVILINYLLIGLFLTFKEVIRFHEGCILILKSFFPQSFIGLKCNVNVNTRTRNLTHIRGFKELITFALFQNQESQGPNLVVMKETKAQDKISYCKFYNLYFSR